MKRAKMMLSAIVLITICASSFALKISKRFTGLYQCGTTTTGGSFFATRYTALNGIFTLFCTVCEGIRYNTTTMVVGVNV